jgi:hypothetical protein
MPTFLTAVMGHHLEHRRQERQEGLAQAEAKRNQ